MPIKMKQCTECKTLCSNSAKKCQVCGSRNLIKGSYTSKKEAQQKLQEEETRKYSQREIILCSLCCSPIPITSGKGYCVYCDEDFYITDNVNRI